CVLQDQRILPLRPNDLDILAAAVDRPPGLGALGEHLIEGGDVLDAAILEPGLKGLDALLAVDGDAVLPGGAAAEHAGEGRAGLSGELERLAEDLVGHTGAEIDEGLLRDAGRLLEQLLGLLAAVGLLAAKDAHALDELHIDGHLDLEHINAVAGL